MSKTIVDRTCTTKTVTRSVIGQKEPLAHPKTARMSALMVMAEHFAGLAWQSLWQNTEQQEG